VINAYFYYELRTQYERLHRARRAHGVAPAYALHDDEQRAFDVVVGFFFFLSVSVITHPKRGAHGVGVGKARSVLLQVRVVQLAPRIDEVRLVERPLDARESRVYAVLGPVEA
jgi:hypothetical protein